MTQKPQNIAWKLKSFDIFDCTVDIFDCSGGRLQLCSWGSVSFLYTKLHRLKSLSNSDSYTKKNCDSDCKHI